MTKKLAIRRRCSTSRRTWWNWICCVILLVCLAAQAQTAKRAAANTASKPAPTNTAYSKLTNAESAMDKQDWITAEQALLDLTTGKEYVARAWFDLGYVYHATGRRPEAVDAYRKAVAADPTVFESNLDLGLLLVGSNDPEAARYLKAATALKPTSHPERQMSRAWFGLGRALAASDPAGAAEALKRGLALDAKNADAHLELGELRGRANDWAGAEKEFAAAAEIDPKSADAQAMLANAYMRQNKMPQAEVALRNVLTADPQNESAHLQLGRVLVTQQRLAEAQEEFQKASELKPEDSDALREIASVSIARKYYPEAEAASRKLLEKNPRDAQLHH
ncbi:MAG TPA: tetratricopeptide repeat protein, partial [Terriglobales bacterium]